jgi:hypothetical protein
MKIQIAYKLKIEGLQFPEEISFSDVTPEFKNICFLCIC